MNYFNPYTYLSRKPYPTQIGTAWYGKHVVIIRCNPMTNQFIKLDTSLHAPTEPPHHSCAETVAQFLSIGYNIVAILPITVTEIHYIMVK